MTLQGWLKAIVIHGIAVGIPTDPTVPPPAVRLTERTQL